MNIYVYTCTHQKKGFCFIHDLKHWLLGYLIIGGDGVKYTKCTYIIQLSWNVILMLKWKKKNLKNALAVQKWKV